MTHVDTTIGPAADGAEPATVHAVLQQRGVLPGGHLVETGFLDADCFVKSRNG
jgi:hypothetical protein